MGVVATGVCPVGQGGAVVLVGVFGHGQGIGVGTKQNGRPVGRTFKVCHDRCDAGSFGDLKREAVKSGNDSLLGVGVVQPQLGVAVDVPSEGDSIAGQFGCCFQDLMHGVIMADLWPPCPTRQAVCQTCRMSLTTGQIHEALGLLLEKRAADSHSTVLGAGSDDLESGRRFLHSLVDGGWMVPDWPSEHGGRDADPDEASMISGALVDYEVADLYPYGVGLNLVGPVLLARGSAEQQHRWLRPIADGSEIWCQMFSEPDAGSDLANAGMRAERDGDEWVLNGSKVWTSRGTYSTWGMCVARTDAAQPKHQGLTMFAVDMSSPGIEVRPLEQMNGDRHFTEVFVTDVRVADTNRLGELGDGWGITVETLAHERATIGGRAFGGGDDSEGGLPSWLEAWNAAGHLCDPVARQAAMRAYVLHRVNQLTTLRATHLAHGGSPGPEGSGSKLRSVAAFKARAYLGKNLAGAAGMLVGSPGHLSFMTGPSMSIRGGTDEVQRNIVGERVLGLPREPSVDRDTPYSELKRSR